MPAGSAGSSPDPVGYRIGVDGGGTKTAFILVDEKGTVLANEVREGSNPNVAGPLKAMATIREGLASVKAQAKGPIELTILCMAGYRAFWKAFTLPLQEYGTCTSTDDSVPVLELATGGNPGLVLHAGTGAFVAARGLDLRTHYAGGLGWRFGDEGSGYDLGKRAVARAVLELQGWAPKSGILDLVRDAAHTDQSSTMLAGYYGDPEANAKLAAFAPAILALAKAGDPAAEAIVADSVGELANLASRVSASLFPGAKKGDYPAGLSGPILNHPVSRRILSSHRSLSFTPVEGTPLDGLRKLLVRGGLT